METFESVLGYRFPELEPERTWDTEEERPCRARSEGSISESLSRRYLKQVQEVDQMLLELERALEERAVVSRALR